MNNRVNFTERHEAGGWAKYLPAISGFYTTHLGKDLLDETFVPASRLPPKFEYGLQGLNFLDPEYSYFTYKYGLYSAGHADRNITRCNDREPMIHKRDREKTIIVGDSGGFQIAKGIIKLDWSKFKTDEGDKLREEILRYLEHTSDWSMTLDVPAFACEPQFTPRTGLTKFDDCLDYTEINLKYFMKNRVPGKTKFLNVLSGTNDNDSKIWYDRVKKYNNASEVEDMGFSRDRAFEGWAFAGVNMSSMISVLDRILDLRRDGLLEGKDWIHFLGIGRLDWACFLTSIERQLRKHDNPNINISFDAASPFVAAGGYALSYTYNKFTPDQLTYSMSRGIDSKDLKGKPYGMPYQGPIMERLTTADMCVMGPGDLNKHGKEGKTSWDTTTYALVMAHNVYNHIQAIQEVNRLADIQYATQKKVNFRDWYTTQHKKTKQSDKSEFIPNTIIYFNQFIEELLDPANKDPRSMIKEYSAFLDHLGFKRKKKKDEFNMLFGVDDTEIDVNEIRAEDLADDYDNEDPPEDE